MSKEKKGKKNASLKVLRKKSARLIRQEYLDYDYVDKLTSEEKQWLANFTSEYYNASVGKQSEEGKNNHFMKSKKDVKDCTDRNKWRNNDVYGKARAHNKVIYTQNEGVFDPQMREKHLNEHLVEDAMVEMLDHKRNNFKKTSSDTDE